MSTESDVASSFRVGSIYQFYMLALSHEPVMSSSLEVEESDEGFSGVFPVGRGLSTMTRPTT